MAGKQIKFGQDFPLQVVEIYNFDSNREGCPDKKDRKDEEMTKRLRPKFWCVCMRYLQNQFVHRQLPRQLTTLLVVQ